MQGTCEREALGVPLRSATAAATTRVSLLSSEAHVNNNDALLLQSTTYEAKYIQPAPLLKGSMYIQNSSELYRKNDDVEINKLTLSQLYSNVYLNYMHKKQRCLELELPVLPGLPDFDGEMPTDPESVMQYVKGLSALYRGDLIDPSPFQLYESLILEFMGNSPVTATPSGLENKENSLNGDYSPSLNSLNGNMQRVSSIPRFQSFTPETEVVALALSMWLSNIKQIRDVPVAMQKIQQFPSSTRALTSSVVKFALDACREVTKGDQCSEERRSEICSLVGLVVLSRGEVREVLEYVGVLEEYSSSCKSSIVPCVLPQHEEILRTLTLSSPKQCLMSSPVDACHGDMTRLPLMLSEGTSVSCFCVSPCGRFLAVATVSGLLLFEANSGKLLAQSTDADLARSLWIMQFSHDSCLILSSKSGLRHVVLSTTLEHLSEHHTDYPAIPTKVTEETFDFLYSPRLPCGSKSSLFLASSGKMVLEKLGSAAEKSVESFVVCTHIHDDFVGNIAVLETSDESFTIRLEEGKITLSQGAYSCFGMLSNNTPWHFVYCKWNRGTWTLGVDNELVELRGARTTQSKMVKFNGSTLLDGTGHVASLAAWCGDSYDGRSIRRFAVERVLDAATKPFFHLPLDEGEGLWVKELATMRALGIPEQHFVWDDTTCSPFTSMEVIDHNVCLPLQVFLSADVLISDYQVLMVFPSAHKGGDGIVVVVQHGGKSINRVYRCPGSYSQTLYALSRDESLLYAFQQRFSTFSVTEISTAARRERRLQESGILRNDMEKGTPEWIVNEILKRIYVDGLDLIRIPPELSPLNIENLLYLSTILRMARQNTNPLKLVAVMSLAMVHFERLVLEDANSLSNVAASLNHSCKQIVEWFPESFVRDVAESLVRAGASQSLTLNDKVSILIDADSPKTADILDSCMSKESLYSILSFVINDNPSIVLSMASGLLKRCSQEEEGISSGRLIVHHMLWFSIFSVQFLHRYGYNAIVSSLLDLYLQHAKQLLVKRLWDDGMQQTVVHTGLLPLLIGVAALCPNTVTPSIEAALLALLDTTPQEVTGSPFSVVFETKQACDVVPGSDDGPFKLLLDYKRATSVAITKEVSSSEVIVITSDSSSVKPTKLILNNEIPFAKVNGSTLVLFGTGDNSLTIVCSYDISVGTPWSLILRDGVCNLLLSLAIHLTEKPKPCDVFLAPLLRHGLDTKTLATHGLDVPGRVNESRFVVDILNDVGDGKKFVDDVWNNMRGSVTPSMRPAFRALLTLLIHSGLSPQQAEDELKLRWFSGEWGSRLQGVGKDSARQLLVDLAKWIASSVYYQRDTSPMYARRASTGRRSTLDSPMMASRSVSDPRLSTASRRSTVRGVMQNQDTLDHVRALFTKGITPGMLECILVERTSSALSTIRGLQLLSSLLTRLQKNESKTLQEILHVLWLFCGEGSGKHMIESLVGSGMDLEMRVRVSFHTVMEECESLLMSKCGKEVSPQAILTYPAHNGSSTVMLLAIMCHPWDAVDCDIFKSTRSEDDMASILAYLEDQTNIPAYSLPLTSPWRLRRDQSNSSGMTNERNAWSELIGVAEHTSINCIFPNSFSVTIPNLQLSELDEGIAFEKTISGSLILRADEAWPMPPLMTCFSGVPRVFYYEVTLRSPCYRFALCLAQCRNAFDHGIDVVYFYENSGTTHDVLCPPFDEGDTIGCGVIATTRRLFFTLNGVFISFMGTVHEKTESLFPTIRINNKDRAGFTVNFGNNAFFYDFRKLHPALCIANGPTRYAVTSTAEITLHYITARACSMQESCKTSAKLFLTKCCEVVCRNVNKVTSSIMNVGVGKTDTPESRIQQAVVLSVAESSILNFIATLRHIMRIANSYPLPEVIGEMVFDAVTVLMMLPVHSIQMSTISFLPELLPHIQRVRDASASSNLVKSLFEHAKVPVDTSAKISFLPYWRQCDPRCMSITHMHLAYMQPEAQRSIVLGNVLPRTGKVSFVVRVFRKGMSKGHSLKGGYYVGISIINLTPLSPASNSQSWKAIKPPIVWALHDVSPQLPHATNPTVKPNNFHRTFGSSDAVRVCVDCDKQTVSFYRDDEFLKTLFTDIPLNVDLVPFVQLYNDDASVSISAGEMTAPISSATLLGAASVDVLRCMLTLEPFERLVADGLCEELDGSAFPNVTLTLFKSIPDPRVLQLCCRTGEKLLVTVRRLTQWRVKISVGILGYYEQINNLRTSSFLTMDGSFDVNDSYASLLGVERCIASLVTALSRLVIPLITTQALCLIEIQQRNTIIEEEKDQWDYLFHRARVDQYLSIQRVSQGVPLLGSPRIPHDYTFSAALSHPGFHFSPRFCGRLATVPSGVENTTTPFIAIAEPAVPVTGHFNLRCQLMRGHTGQILGGGYYFGLCTTSFDWKRRDLNVGNPEVWAIHDMDDAPWRLRHLYPGTRFQIAADPGCIIVSGDVVRIEVDRDKGTMHAYRTGVNQEELLLGLIFDNVPKGTELFPFVHLYNTDAVAVLLPSESERPAIRTTVPQPHFAICISNEKRNCDGCVAPHPDVRLSSQIWYKCNECVDYSLCKSCFELCLHSHHAFTEMGTNPLVHDSAPPTKTVVGMNVMIPGTTGLYLKSWGCRVLEKYMNCVVESKENNALVLWGVVYKKTAAFTVTVDTLNGEPLHLDTPMFIGIGEAEEIISLSTDMLRNRCISGSPNVVSICSDSSMCRKLNSPSRSPYGFEHGSTISIEVDIALGVATIRRDWLKLGTQSFPKSPVVKPANLVGFVLFGRKNVTASIFSEENQTFSAVVEDVKNGLLRVVHEGQVRFIRPEHCRVPLAPCQDIPKLNTLGYVFWKKELAQCKVVGVEKDELTLYFAGENLRQRIPYSRFLTDSCGSIAEERLLHREVGEVGATVTDGFIISRLLLILSCLCESESLSSFVLSHCPALLNVLSRLAAVEISNDAPTEFIQEVRTAVAITCNGLRVITRNKHLPGYVPSSVMETYQCEPIPNMLMCAVEDPSKGKIFTVCEVGTNNTFKGVEISSTSPSTSVLLNTADCIPVKQCDGKPWWKLDNGLPCSLLEHTLRVTQSGHGSLNVTMEGEWQGEITIPRRGSGSILLQLRKDCSGLANVAFSSHTIECVVFGEYMRYCRTVRLCLYRATNSTRSHGFHYDGEGEDSSFETAVTQLETILTGNGENSLIIVMDGVMDGEGQRVVGEWKPKNDRAGTFAVNSFRRVSFVPLTTKLAHIEPLPDCKDPIIPLPPQRDMSSTMHRLVVLLARHLYLFILNRSGVVDQKAIRGIIHFHSHPLTDQLISNYIDMEQLLRTVYDTLHLILEPNTKPWDSTTLSLLITKCLLLRPEVATYFPTLLWDSFHAVVATSHQCGIQYRHHLLKNIIVFIEKHREGFDHIYTQLLSVLLTWVDRSVSSFLNSSEIRRDVAAGVELVMSLGVPFLGNIIHHIPLAPLQCLIDMADSLRGGVALPIMVDLSEDEISIANVPPVEALCVFGEFVDGVLKVGKIMSSCAAASRGKFYYEVTLPDRLSAPFVVGWGTEEHTEVPSQHVGSDACSFAFTGNELSSKSTKEEYKPGNEVSPGSVIGCLINMNEKLVAWSVNGVYGPFIPIPIDCGGYGLYAFTSTGSCNGMRVSLDAAQFEYVPDGYSDLSGRHTRVQIPLVSDVTLRSKLPIRPISFYEQLASYISDVEETSVSKQNGNNSSFSAPSSTGMELPETVCLLRYPSVAQLNYEERRDYIKVVRVAESCMATARRFIDLDSEVVDGRLSTAFLLMKHIVRRSFGKNLLVSIPLVEKNNNPPSITVRITELYSTLPRTPEIALQHSILSQIYKQIGSFTNKQLRQSPLFKVHLYISGTGHAPQDLGGPYRQLWTFLSEEIMTHPDKCYPHTDYHRNPLCRYLNNSQRVALVPDSSANSAYDIVLLNFLGKMMGHVAAAKTPLALDFSPFVWKYLVEDILTVKDYYKYVDSVVEKSMEDTDFLTSGMAEEIIPNLTEKWSTVAHGEASETSEEVMVHNYRRLAEECLVHSMDLQLNALREGMWCVLPKRVVRCLSWRELERMVCGDSNLTPEVMRQCIEVQLQGPREQAFWRIIDELSLEQRSSFLCFACGQKRLPLIRKVKVTENTESTDHLPRAQSCSSLVTVPPYDTYELFREKFLIAISHEMEMELA